MWLTLLAAAAILPTDTGTARRDTASTLPQVTLSGEVRTRSELEHLVAAPRADALTYLRTRLGARATIGDAVRLVVGVQDSRVLGTQAHANAASTLDLHEGYLEIIRPLHGARLALRAGRQEIALGNERLIGRVNWSNVGQAFDGLRLTAAPSGGRMPWSATAFAVTRIERGTVTESDLHLYGASATRALPGAGGTGELTLLHDRGVHARGREVTARTTVAARVHGVPLLGLRADLEGAVQRGAEHALPTSTAPLGPRETIRAWMLGARLGTPVGTAAAPRRVTALAGLDVLSGDVSKTDRRDGAFSTLFATNHPFYGTEDVIAGDPAASLGGRGLVDAFTSVTYAAARTLSLRADLHRLATARPRGLSDGLLGWEADVAAPYRVLPGATIEAGYAAFRAGDAGTALGLGRAGHVRGWGYLQLTAGF
ncbi:alginate export family protein [Roseisolibacter agri]|uniref:Alginate export domain-containing protein n=1 Tax=Roseisolibacter agri TaxID=2014610 RepID=A0AA37Q4V9_9BACT|nr:alginate export family protein [Roseisolibacter agri]GLC23822.1 hypothetical protein rosag_03350 [Roseisolibacter agri]